MEGCTSHRAGREPHHDSVQIEDSGSDRDGDSSEWTVDLT